MSSKAVVCLLIACVLLLAGGCASSSGALERAARNKPGVLSVKVEEDDVGDDDIPFASPPKLVTVVMDANASVPEIREVFEAYDGRGGVEGVEVVLSGPKHASVGRGEGIHATDRMIQDLVRAQHDDGITEYWREADPAGTSVTLTLASDGFDDVVAVADRYRGDKDRESVSVRSGDFALDRESVNGDLALADARQQFVQLVDRRFHLTGALVDGRDGEGVTLAIGKRDQPALRRFVMKEAPPSLGGVHVRAKALPDR